MAMDVNQQLFVWTRGEPVSPLFLFPCLVVVRGNVKSRLHKRWVFLREYAKEVLTPITLSQHI